MVDTSLLLSNLLNPPVLFFFLGMIAIWAGSDLDIPQPLPKFFSLYLLLSLGFKGGVELNHSGVNAHIALTLLAAIAMALLIPFASFWVLKKRMAPADAAAVAAVYGSVSAVTFITATSFLNQVNVPFGGHMVAAMALMESPAIIVGVLLARLNMREPKKESSRRALSPALLRDAVLNGSVLLLVGSFIIGLLTGESGEAALKPFTGDIFKGILCLFLLDMGLVSARRLKESKIDRFAILFALISPPVNAALGLIIAWMLRLTPGDALLFCVLCGSASYIAVPAAVRLAIPKANPGLYLTMALAITFPFNIIIGIPLYMAIINSLWK